MPRVTYTITVGGKVTPYPSFEAAQRAASDIFARTGIVVGIDLAR